MKQPTTAEDLTAVREQLREEISEARGTLKDLRHEIRTARGLIDATREFVTRLVQEDVKAVLEAEVATQVALLGKTTEEAMSKSVDKVNKEFDHLADLLMGRERATEDREKRSIPELLEDPVILARAQHSAREASRD